MLVFLAIFAVLTVFSRLRQQSTLWRGILPHDIPLVHLDVRMGVRPYILGHAVPVGYRLACLYFGTGLIDRTRTIDHGFPYNVLDPIPPVPTAAETVRSIALAAERAREIVQLAQRRKCRIRLLWSGGTVDGSEE